MKKKKQKIKLHRKHRWAFQKIAEEIKLKYKKSLINKKSLVLFENKVNGKNEFFGRDEFSNSVIVKSNENLVGKIENINIFDGNRNTLFGTRVINDKGEFAA